MTTSESSEMIMDNGLDTLSQVALAETICFESYHGHEAGLFGTSRLPSESVEDLNTPSTSSSDMSFFVDTMEPLPITASGRFSGFTLNLLCVNSIS